MLTFKHIMSPIQTEDFCLDLNPVLVNAFLYPRSDYIPRGPSSTSQLIMLHDFFPLLFQLSEL